MLKQPVVLPYQTAHDFRVGALGGNINRLLLTLHCYRLCAQAVQLNAFLEIVCSGSLKIVF